MDSRRFEKTTAAILMTIAVYFIAGRLGLSVATPHRNISFVWPPAGFALAVLLIGGYRLWPGVFLGAFLVNFVTNIGWPAALAIACGNTFEAVLGAFLLRRFVRGGFQNSMERVSDAVALIALAGTVSTTIAATVGVTTLSLQGSADWPSYKFLWFEWWIGDMLGVLVIAPFLLTWSNARVAFADIKSNAWRTLEAVALFLVLFAAAKSVFGGWSGAHVASYPHSYIIFPFLIWIAIRFGPKGASAAILVVSFTAVWETLHGEGPFADVAPYEALLLLQLFMVMVVLTTLVLAATTAERKRSEQVKSDFASMVTHELRTPLSSIKAGIEVVLDGIDGPVTEDQARTLGIAKNNVNRLARLIDNVLDYSKLESRRMDMIFEKTDLTQLLEEIYELMKPSVQNKGIEWHREFPEAPFPVVCDADKIKQVLINLIDNAIKFTDQGGTISLRLKRINRRAHIEVEDTGVGIRPEDQERIFEMFGQASPPGKTRRHGSGIGLAVCRLITDQHQGRIDVDSAPGEGSRLTIDFPDSLPETKKSVTSTKNR